MLSSDWTPDIGHRLDNLPISFEFKRNLIMYLFTLIPQVYEKFFTIRVFCFSFCLCAFSVPCARCLVSHVRLLCKCFGAKSFSAKLFGAMLVSHVWCPMSDVQCPMFSIRCPVSDVQLASVRSGVRCPMSGNLSHRAGGGVLCNPGQN